MATLEDRVRARRKDANHAEVLDYLRDKGWSVLDLAQHGVSVDAAVSKDGWCALLEIKDGAKPPSKRKLTEEEQALKNNWEGPYILATNPQEAEILLERVRNDGNAA